MFASTWLWFEMSCVFFGIDPFTEIQFNQLKQFNT